MTMLNVTDELQEIRDAVRSLCREFPDEYFRKVDEKRGNPDAFVSALIHAGWLAAIVSDGYAGSGSGLPEASVIMEEINRSGGNSGAVHGQMYNKGTLLRNGTKAQKEMYLPKIAACELRNKNQEPPNRTSTFHATIYSSRPFPAGDGRTMMWGLQNERKWRVFCEKVLPNAALASDERFSLNAKRLVQRDALQAPIEHAFANLSAEDEIARLDAADIANAHANSISDIWSHPQLKARDRWTAIETPAVRLPALCPPGMGPDWPAKMGPVPKLGEHTDAIRVHLGYTDNMADLHAKGVV